jgi:diketogulonate reductase-like aldo/keto reductase
MNHTRVPEIIYGTAWKEDRSERLTALALAQGFRAVDTTNQRRHYHEAGVGAAIAAAIKKGEMQRDDLFLQSKFTFRRGQDHRLPYDPDAPVSVQVEQSFASSLEHLKVEVLDSYLLHGPTQRSGLSADDWAAWKAMEVIHDSGRVRSIGVSNVALGQLKQLHQGARAAPLFVQNRCYASTGWDREVRAYCAANSIQYQGFSLLTANPQILASPVVARIAKRLERTAAAITFRFAIQIGIIPLTGTSDPQHMKEDLDVLNFRLDPSDIDELVRISTG